MGRLRRGSGEDTFDNITPDLTLSTSYSPANGATGDVHGRPEEASRSRQGEAVFFAGVAG